MPVKNLTLTVPILKKTISVIVFLDIFWSTVAVCLVTYKSKVGGYSFISIYYKVFVIQLLTFDEVDIMIYQPWRFDIQRGQRPMIYHIMD